MSKKIILFFGCAVLFFGYHLVEADVLINEVQLSPSEERFLELYNTDDVAIDLTGWYMQRKTATGSSFGSLVSKPNFEGKTISGHDYFVISRNSLENSDIVLDSLTLTESNAIQIKNSDGELVDKIGWGNANECSGSCPPNPSEGESMQRTSGGSFTISTPTPGEVNKTSSVAGDENSNDENEKDQSTTANDYGAEAEEKTTVTQKIKVQIITKSLAYVGIPFLFQGMVLRSDGEQLFNGRFFWNFGDGDSREVGVINTDKFSHTYFYPGEYIVLLEHYPDHFADVPDAREQIVIKVVNPAVSISNTGNEKDFFIELWNNSDYNVDLSNWFLTSDQRSFIIPRNTILASKKKMIISSRISNFSVVDRNTLKLLNSQGETVFNYSSFVAPFAPVPITSRQKAFSVEDQSTKVTAPFSEEEIFKEISIENLEASAIESNIAKNNSIRVYFFTTIFTIFLGASAGAVYFIRKKKNVSGTGYDFKILDE